MPHRLAHHRRQPSLWRTLVLAACAFAPLAVAATELNEDSQRPLAERMRWSVGNRVGLGASIDGTASSQRPMMVGVHADMTRQTRLIYEVRTPARPALTALEGAATDAAPRDRWALEVRPSHNAAQQLRASLFRVELSGASAVTLRPRKGGVAVAWQARF